MFIYTNYQTLYPTYHPSAARHTPPRPLTSVPSEVHDERGLVREPLRAQVAAVAPLARMPHHVIRQVSLGLEGGRALGALPVPAVVTGSDMKDGVCMTCYRCSLGSGSVCFVLLKADICINERALPEQGKM